MTALPCVVHPGLSSLSAAHPHRLSPERASSQPLNGYLSCSHPREAFPYPMFRRVPRRGFWRFSPDAARGESARCPCVDVVTDSTSLRRSPLHRGTRGTPP